LVQIFLVALGLKIFLPPPIGVSGNSLGLTLLHNMFVASSGGNPGPSFVYHVELSQKGMEGGDRL
jgi:hypothetical protein